ncbi:MAG: TetR/AcrR family transcriptional regulator [Actinomycetota bacterium]
MTTTAEGEQLRRIPLSRDTIVAGAIALADAEGIRAITMRKLAAHLGYEVMSLYNHVANKGEVLTLMVDGVAGEVETPADDIEPLTAVRHIAQSLRTALVRHPWSPDLWQRHLPGPERSRIMEDLLRLLGQSDLTPAMAHHGFHAVTNHVIGYTIQELGLAEVMAELELDAVDYRDSLDPDEFPHMIAHINQHLDGDTAPSFDLVLDLILEGIARLSAERRAAGDDPADPAGACC